MTLSQYKKQNPTSKIPNIPNYTPICTSRVGKLGKGLLTYIKHNITFTDLNIPTIINTHNTVLQMVRHKLPTTLHLHTRFILAGVVVKRTHLTL